MNKVALVTGITGQDGSYLAEFLIDKGYKVIGLKRRSSSPNTDRIDQLLDSSAHNNSLEIVYSDLTDSASLNRVVSQYRPDEIYNLAAQSHVQVSFENPVYTAQTGALGTLHLLEAIRNTELTNHTRFYQASTSELYGKVVETPQRETTPFYPRSPYAAAKLYSYWITVNYRESYDMFACNGILFNHESPRRGHEFVTRKITHAVAAIKHGKQSKILLGNLDARRDWGHAKDYVRGMWQMLQHDVAEDFVLASGKTVTVREFVELAFNEVGITIEWSGSGIEEKGICSQSGKTLVEISEQFFRPAEVDLLLGDATKAKSVLGWQSEISLQEMVSEMVAADLRAFDKPRQV